MHQIFVPYDHMAMWSFMPSTGSSRLFHRWLLILNARDHAMYPVIEHHNDIPLDCRVSNLTKAIDAIHNNNSTHRLSHAFSQGKLMELAIGV
jgi:hypothetical protein